MVGSPWGDVYLCQRHRQKLFAKFDINTVVPTTKSGAEIRIQRADCQRCNQHEHDIDCFVWQRCGGWIVYSLRWFIRNGVARLRFDGTLDQALIRICHR